MKCNNTNNQKDDEENNKRANKLTIVAAILVLVPLALVTISIFGDMIPIVVDSRIFTYMYLIGLTLLVAVRLKYPNNKASKLLGIIVVLLTIVVIIKLVMKINACLEDCGRLG